MIQKRINSHREEIPLSCSWAYLSNFHPAALLSFSFGYWEDGCSPPLLPHKPLCNFSGAVTDVSQAPTGSLTCVCSFNPHGQATESKSHSWEVGGPGYESRSSGSRSWTFSHRESYLALLPLGSGFRPHHSFIPSFTCSTVKSKCL